MKKLFIAATCALLAAAVATPTMAKDHSISGFMRVKGVMANIALQDDAKPDKYLDQRFRAKWNMNLNEYVSVVYYAEVDFQYGDSAYNVQDGARGRNGGGAVGGDQNNIETKNAYMDVKIPETPVSFRLGLQGFASPDYALWLMDAAGLTVNFKADMFDGQFAYAKLIEGDTANGRVENPGAVNGENDADFYSLKATAKPMDALKVGASLTWIRNRFSAGTGGTGGPVVNFGFSSGLRQLNFDEYFLILDGSYKLDMLTLSGWAAANFGTVDKLGSATDPNADGDFGGYAATVAVAGKASGIGFGARALYWSGDDDSTDSDIDSMYTPLSDGPVRENAPFVKDGLMLMFSDAFTTTVGSSANLNGIAMDSAYAGFGLVALTANASFTPPAMEKAYIKGAVGYFMATEDDRKLNGAGGTKDREGTSIGTEIAVRAGYKVADAVDLSINGAYAMLGDFFDKSTTDAAGNLTEPDDPYVLYLMANVGF